MKKVVMNTLNRVCPTICPDCGADMYTEIEEHTNTREFLLYRCPECDETFCYLEIEENSST